MIIIWVIHITSGKGITIKTKGLTINCFNRKMLLADFSATDV